MVNARIPAMERLLASQPKDQQTKRSWFEFRNADTDDEGPVELFIYDVIDDWFGVSAEMFARELSGIDAQEITVRINSPGGNVFDGIAILNALRGHKARVTTIVDGLAASAASFIAMAGDEIVMNRNAEMMIHDASGVCIGNAKDMGEMHDMLERVSNNIASIYADRTGTDAAEWRTAMLAETWYSADEAVDAGLADRVESAGDETAGKTKNRFDLSIFNYAGRDKAPTPTPLAATGAPEVNGGKEAITMATLNEGLAERLGIPADADDETVLSALDEALAERAAGEPEPQEQQPAAHLPEGVVAIDAATLEELRAAATRGDQARAEQERVGRISAVDDAVRTGRISPAQRETWLNRLEADPAEADVLNTLAPVYPVTGEIGHAANPTNQDDGDSIMTSLFGQEA
ncbi:capsid maturation protease [Gordonia phage Sahara]|uniref:Capsid maturation protease n=1 Tax=Gordonia phage Sahara TaxID=2859488 RepID=A0AAE7WK62_9CAUD|nr:capsid maturation protease [Gordonia phage Sahara]QYW00735.1 capsid maturation protease [Gordonia phage Sahara]